MQHVSPNVIVIIIDLGIWFLACIISKGFSTLLLVVIEVLHAIGLVADLTPSQLCERIEGLVAARVRALSSCGCWGCACNTSAEASLRTSHDVCCCNLRMLFKFKSDGGSSWLHSLLRVSKRLSYKGACLGLIYIQGQDIYRSVQHVSLTLTSSPLTLESSSCLAALRGDSAPCNYFVL